MCRVVELNYEIANRADDRYINDVDADRHRSGIDRRGRRRGGRRDGDRKKPWYFRRRFLLTTASLAFAGWRRVRTVARRTAINH
jgi:hypothetical protein